MAFKAATKAIEADSTKSNGYAIRGMCLYKDGNTKDAILDLGFALTLNHKDEGANLAMVIALEKHLNLEKIETQLFYCDQAIQCIPNNSYLYKRRGILRYLNGDKEDACSDLRKAYLLGAESAKSLIDEFCI
jgi:Flp pilus assembly protein TadD